MKKLILIFSLLTNIVISQNKEITISFDIYLDNKKIETDKVSVGFINNDTVTHYSVISNSFVTFFKSNKVYNMVITHPNYNKQIFRIDTKLIKSNNIDVYLSSNSSDIYTNQLEYNNILKKYIVYK